MNKLQTILKDEITRLARREVRKAVTPLLAAIKRLKAADATLKAEIVALKQSSAAKTAVPSPSVTDAELKSARFSGGLIRKLRKRLGLTASQMAKLVGVSTFSIHAWESGKTRPKLESQKALVALRKMSKSQARKRVAEGRG